MPLRWVSGRYTFTGEDDFTHAKQDKTTSLGEMVQVLEPLESHIEVDKEG